MPREADRLVTILFADDNYGNIMSVKPWDMDHKGGAGIYYHADYVGHPRNYRWMNTNSYAKSESYSDLTLLTYQCGNNSTSHIRSIRPRSGS